MVTAPPLQWRNRPRNELQLQLERQQPGGPGPGAAPPPSPPRRVREEQPPGPGPGHGYLRDGGLVLSTPLVPARASLSTSRWKACYSKDTPKTVTDE